MNLTGHLAVAYLLARRRPVRRLHRLGPLAVGALLPDAIDKPVMLVGLSPYGRTVGHSLTFWSFAWVFATIAVVGQLRGATPFGLIVAGGWSHLVTDLVDDLVEGVQYTGYAFSAWAGWPFTTPDMWSMEIPHFLSSRPHATTVLEWSTVVVCVVLALRDPGASEHSTSRERCRSKSAT